MHSIAQALILGAVLASPAGPIPALSASYHLPEIRAAQANQLEITALASEGAPTLQPSQRDPVLASQLEARLDWIESRLGVTEAQMPLWVRHAAALRDDFWQRKGAEAWVARMQASVAAPTLLDRLEWRYAVKSAELASLTTVVTTLRDLYPMLSEAQRQAFDEVAREMER